MCQYGYTPINGVCVCQDPIQCPGGMITPCQFCPVGTYSTALGATDVSICAACPIGTYSPNQAQGSNCTACGAGTYSYTTGVSACTACPAGTYSTVVGAASPSNCTACAPGSYALYPGMSQPCPLCGPGFYGSASGMTACVMCSSDLYGQSYTVMNGATSINVCITCQAGNYATYLADGSFGCAQCAAGTYATAVGATSNGTCLPCAPNTYASAGGASSCVACVGGAYATAYGATAQSACVGCLAGAYFAAGACVGCPAGTFATGTGAASSAVCAGCAPGAFAPAANASACTACAAGTSAANASATACDVCTAPTLYAAAVGGGGGATACAACADGWFSTAALGGGGTACAACAKGTYGAGCAGTCPPHTTTAGNGTATLLGCSCADGYVCVYTKRIRVVLTLRNTSLANFTVAAQTALVASVAAAAGVPTTSVTLVSVHGSTSRRRALLAASWRPSAVERGAFFGGGGAFGADEDDAEPFGDGAGDLLRLHLEIAGPAGLHPQQHDALRRAAARHGAHVVRWRHAHSVRIMRRASFF